jgi:ceramide glucosyltransferase
MMRDLLLPVIWLEGWIGDTFVWRGNDMSVAKEGDAGRSAARRALAMFGNAN